VARKEEDKLRSYLLQQKDLGFDELYLPVATRPSPPGKLKRLNMDNFRESKSLEQLEMTINSCQMCPLGKTRTKFVFGVGSPNADVMFIGEAPGREEDLKGEPFVGRAGKLLDKMLPEVGLRRQDVYIANILKCRPPDNRDPLPEEADECEPYLRMQIKLIRPKIICCLGRIAAQTLLKTNMSLGAMRSRWFDYHGIRFMVTYHPAALLRTNAYTETAMADLRRLVAERDKF
jgi:uracil-DNA glycosylase family 4